MTTQNRHIDYEKADFLTSADNLSQCPADTGTEVAFAGRSNAGKSSALNTLTNQPKLARTSKTPGRTQLINFFNLNEDNSQRLVDLPGYGYAKVPIAVKKRWQKHLDEYLRLRESLKGIVLLMDIRRPLQEFDETMIEWAASSEMPMHILLTKSDKLKKGPAQAALLSVRRELKSFDGLITVQIFSSLKHSGLGELKSTLGRWLAG